MNEVITRFQESLYESKLHFSVKPILIGGMAMEYYGMRKSGADIDLIIADETCNAISRKEKRFIW